MFTPSPGKRTDKIDVASGLTASRGSKGSHKKKGKQVHHLQPPGQPRIDFRRLIKEHGSFAKARKALRHRQEEYQDEVIRQRENEFTDSHLGDLFDETVRLSGVSGPPTLNTPFDKMKEVMALNARVKVRRSYRKSSWYDVLPVIHRFFKFIQSNHFPFHSSFTSHFSRSVRRNR